MAGADAFQVRGTIIEVLPNRTFRAELANGHRLLAFRVGKARENVVGPAVGDEVMLALSPYDLSEGRIISDTKTVLQGRAR